MALPFDVRASYRTPLLQTLLLDLFQRAPGFGMR